MRKLVAALIVVPLGVLLVALSVVNRKPVTLGLNPFDAGSLRKVPGQRASMRKRNLREDMFLDAQPSGVRA